MESILEQDLKSAFHFFFFRIYIGLVVSLHRLCSGADSYLMFLFSVSLFHTAHFIVSLVCRWHMRVGRAYALPRGA